MPRRGENIRKRQDGRWEARLNIGRDSAGRTRYKSVYGKTYTEVKEKRRQLAAQSQPAVPVQGESLTFGRLLHEWLAYVQPEVKETTYSRYVFQVRRHIEPELGSLQAEQITGEVIDAFARKKLESGKLAGDKKQAAGEAEQKSAGGRGLSPKTVACLLSVIKLALDYGRTHSRITAQPPVIHCPRQAAPDIRVLDIREQELLEHAVLDTWEDAWNGVLLSLFAGLRIGEVCALRWEDIHFETGIVTVERTVTRIQDTRPGCGGKTRIVMGKPKTDSSNRRIPVQGFLLQRLAAARKEPQAYVLTGTSHYMEPRNYYRKYKCLMKSCGLEEYNYHALRHTFATRCVENGFDIKSLSEILGHSDINITLCRYVHPSMELKRQQMERLSKISVCGQ